MSNNPGFETASAQPGDARALQQRLYREIGVAAALAGDFVAKPLEAAAKDRPTLATIARQKVAA